MEYNYDVEETLYSHEEQEAGGLAMQALVETKDSEFLELLGDYVRSIDVDHTVHLHDLLDSARAAYSESELTKLFAFLDDAGFQA